MVNIAEKILDKIKKDHITPEAKWKFLLKDWVYWGSFIFTIILGAISFSLTEFSLRDSDWDIYPLLNRSFLGHLFNILPYFWIIAIFLFLVLATLNFKHTKRGYRFSPFLIVGVSIIISIILGSGLSYAGVDQILDETLSDTYPPYADMMMRRHLLWDNSTQGLLIGKVESIEDGYILLSDPRGNVWKIDIESARMSGLQEITPGKIIKIMGERKENNNFSASQFRRPVFKERFFPIPNPPSPYRKK